MWLDRQRFVAGFAPTWLPAAGLLASIVLAALILLHANPEMPRALQVALVLVALAPWLVEAFHKPPHELVFMLTALVGAGTIALVDGNPYASMFLVLVTGRTATNASTGLALTTLGASILIVVIQPQVSDVEPAVPQWTIGLIFAWFTGISLRRQRDLITLLRLAEEDRARISVLEERERLTTEIHDVIAHSMTVTMLHLSSAQLAIHDEPDEAEQSLREAQRLGRQSLAEIRRTVDMLSGDGRRAEPMPSADNIPDLVEGYRQVGMAVDLSLTGLADKVPDATGLAVYRIVQEALTNAAKHAPGGATEVVIDLDRPLLNIEISTDRSQCDAVGATGSLGGGDGDHGNGSGGGRGLLGMRRRVEMLGGTIVTGPEAGRWIVRCDLPVTDEGRVDG